jgi:hypothetical protein
MLYGALNSPRFYSLTRVQPQTCWDQHPSTKLLNKSCISRERGAIDKLSTAKYANYPMLSLKTKLITS